MSELSPRARAILEEGRASDEPTEADKQRLRLKVAAALAEEPPAGEGPAVGLPWRRGRGGGGGAAGGGLRRPGPVALAVSAERLCAAARDARRAGGAVAGRARTRRRACRRAPTAGRRARRDAAAEAASARATGGLCPSRRNRQPGGRAAPLREAQAARRSGSPALDSPLRRALHMSCAAKQK